MENTRSEGTGTRRPAPERFPFTKFLPPVLDERVVTEHLVARLDAAISTRPLTVVTAPAGSGKTTALAAWAAAAVGDAVWVRLGPDDDQPTVLAAALLEGGRRQLGSDFGGRLGQLLAYAGAAPRPRQLAISLVNDLGDHRPVALVLDDVHEVTDPDALGFLDELLELLPPEVKVVLGSRVEPDLSLARRRVRGEVAELGLDELLLDREAIGSVLAHETSVSDAQVDAVLAASGGWAAAVRLASAHVDADAAQPIAADGAAVPAMAPDLQRFLAEEVLDGLPRQLRSFLLETSILDELSPDDCDAVTERTDSQQVLAELDRRNLFLTRHRGATGDTWKSHDLFTGFLREQLAAQYSAEHIRALHRRAAEAMPPFRSLPHLLAARDHAAAADLIVDLGFSDLDTSTVLQLMPAVRALPAEIRDTNHRLAMLLAWPQHVAGQAHAVVCQLEPLRDRLVAAGHEPDVAEVNTMLAEAYLQLGDLNRAGRAIEHALRHVDEAWRPIVLAVATWWNYYRSDWPSVSRCIQEAVELALRSGEPRLYKMVGPALSPLLLFVDRGPAWVAEAVDRLAAGLSEDDHATLTGMRPVRAGAALLRLDIARAATELRQCLSESMGYGRMAWKHQEAEALLMAVCRGTGDLATVQRILDDALPRLDEPVYRQYRNPYIYAAMRLHWLVGEHRHVVAIYERFLAATPRGGHAEEAVVRAVGEGMVARIEGRADDALEVLREGEEAQRDGRCWLWVGLPGLDRASALLEAGRAAAAIEAALPTLDMAARVGPGILLSEARANRAVLERCGRAGVYVDLLRAVLAASQPAGGARDAVGIPGTDELLSARELEVLAHVASGASNRDIAGALFISEATVKSHLTRVLRKLGASSRTEAVARARDLRLL
jgi:LuxR family transcriptional regulator, maltose regulon positive regulatory protein